MELLDLEGGTDRLPRRFGKKKKNYELAQRNSPEERQKPVVSHEARRLLSAADLWRGQCHCDGFWSDYVGLTMSASATFTDTIVTAHESFAT
jgi:hypothetical protein